MNSWILSESQRRAYEMKLKGCPELECSKAAPFCDFFLEGKERNEVIEFWGLVIYIFNEYDKIFVKVKKEL